MNRRRAIRAGGGIDPDNNNVWSAFWFSHPRQLRCLPPRLCCFRFRQSCFIWKACWKFCPEKSYSHPFLHAGNIAPSDWWRLKRSVLQLRSGSYCTGSRCFHILAGLFLLFAVTHLAGIHIRMLCRRLFAVLFLLRKYRFIYFSESHWFRGTYSDPWQADLPLYFFQVRKCMNIDLCWPRICTANIDVSSRYMYGFFWNRDLYPLFLQYGKCIWSFQACRPTSFCRSYSENRTYDHIRWKHAKSGLAGIHMTCLEKKIDMKNYGYAQEAVHIHFWFWNNARYAKKNSSYTKFGNSNTYGRCRLLFP